MAISTDMLAAFVAVAGQSSVSAAAAELGVGKSLISKRVAQLESAVKATLFSRSTRRIALTPAGEAYLDFARRALDEVAAAQERLRDLRAEMSGLIRLTAPVSWGQQVLMRALPDFLRRHPSIEVEVLLSDRMMDLAHERIDIALRWSGTLAADPSTTPLSTIDWLLAAAPAYLAEAGTPGEPAELAAHACIAYWRERADDACVLTRDAQRVQVRLHSRLRVDNPEAVAEAARAGLGIALLPGYLCDAALRGGTLKRVLPEWTPHTRFGSRISAVVTPERLRLTRNRVLLDYLRQRLS